MIKDFKEIQELFNIVCKLPKLDNDYCVLFVYNTPNTMRDNHHLSECIFEEELHMILSSFRRIAKNVYGIDGEDAFIRQITHFKEKFPHILVYSMAQNLDGDGRRSLIPLLCDYYQLINIGGDFISTVMGRSKDIMYSILQPKGFPFPKTYYIHNVKEIERVTSTIHSGKWLLKPNNESSSIGMEVHQFDDFTTHELFEKLVEYQKIHPVFCVQEFISGDEVAVPILKICDNYYSPGISKVDFPPDKDYIDYDMVSLETYGYSEYDGCIKDLLFEISMNVAKTLKMTALSRIDFRIRNNVPYIEDIGANPTVSEHNGVNQLYCTHLQSEPWAIYAVIVYAGLIEHGLFEPPFHHSPQ